MYEIEDRTQLIRAQGRLSLFNQTVSIYNSEAIMSGKQMKRLRRAMASHGTTVTDAGYETPGARRLVRDTGNRVSVGEVTLPIKMVSNSGRALYQKVKNDLKRNKTTLA